MKYFTMFCFVICVTKVSANSTPVIEQSAQEYQEYLAQGIIAEKEHASVEPEDEESVELMQDEALSLGIQGGSYWASQQITQYLSAHNHILDRIDFKPVVIEYPQYFVLPVVVSEDDGRSRINSDGKLMRILGKSFFIESEPRLLTTVPSWRDYLYVDALKPKRPHKAYNKYIEKYPTIWANGIKEGWDVGVEQAIYTIETRISRMTRDYVGLVRYHLLKDQRIISAPQIKEVYRPVSGGGRELSIEDTIVEIDVSPELSTNRFNWRMVPELPDVSYLFPDDLQSGLVQRLRPNAEQR